MSEVINFNTNQGLTALDIETQIASIPMNKENAIKLMVISKMLSAREDEAKEYLLNRCDDCEVYTSGQLQLLKVDGQRTTYTNAKITKLSADIKKEQDKIKKDNSLGEVKVTPYTSFKIKK